MRRKLQNQHRVHVEKRHGRKHHHRHHARVAIDVGVQRHAKNRRAGTHRRLTEFADERLVLHQPARQRPYAEEDDGCHRKAEKAEQRVKIAVHIHLRDGEKQADRQRAFEHVLIRGLAKGLVQHADAAQKPAQQNHQKHRHRRVEGKDKAIHGYSLPSGLQRLPPRNARENVPLQNRVYSVIL